MMKVMARTFPPLEQPQLTPLAEREVQVWHVVASASGPLADLCREILTADELTRYARMRVCAARDEFLIARGCLRMLLGNVLGCEPKAVDIAARPDGKPSVAGVEFNLSHSHGHILIALCREAAVGVDLEWMDASVDVMELAQANFAVAEVEAIQGNAGQQCISAFYDCWAKKEALVKAHGAGLKIPLQSFVAPIGVVSETRVSLPGARGTQTDLYVRELDPPSGFAAALAVSRPGFTVDWLKFPVGSLGTKWSEVTPSVLLSGDAHRTQVELAAPPKLPSLDAREATRPHGRGVFKKRQNAACSPDQEVPMSHNGSKTVALFGLPITNVTMAEAVARVEEYIQSDRMHQIATANLDFARNSLNSARLQRVICDCSMVLPDGAPMLWAAKLFGRPLQERVTGCDLIPELAQISALKGYGIFLLGSNDRNTRKAAYELEQQFPGVRIVGRYSPPIAELDQMNDAVILRKIEAAAPDILLVAFGNPKQELWIHKHRNMLNVPVAIGIGGSLEMISGSVRRAPKWLQLLHMEWAFRMTQEPMRLFPRYFHDAIALVRHLPTGLLMHRLQPSRQSIAQPAVEVKWPARVVSMPETVTGGICAFLLAEANSAAKERQMFVVDLTATTRIEADGLGSLLEARRIMLEPGLSIWLSGMSNALRMFLQASAVVDLFLLAGTSADVIRLAAVGGNYERRGVRPVALPTPMDRRRRLESA